MEARLQVALPQISVEPRAQAARAPAAAGGNAKSNAADAETGADEMAAASDAVPLQDDMPPLWPDEAAETAFLSEAKARGEVPVPAAAEATATEETPDASAPLPSLDELVKRLTPGVRETLDDLFRAKFVKVQRVPKKALKARG